jgi:bacillithiol biosynthesis cysteine-adding enzyme BshC
MKIVTLPSPGGPLVQGYLAGDPTCLAFYPGGHPSQLESYARRARAIDGTFTLASRERIAGALRGGGEGAEARLARFVEDGGYLVTTGQQPGLFGGPLFSVYKALTAAALARKLEDELGRPVIPVFWVAGEDHDWEEVRRVTLPSLENALEDVEVPVPEHAVGAPLHRVAPEARAMEAARAHVLSLLPPSDFRPELEEALARSYPSGSTLPGGFASWMVDILGPAGVMILEPEQAPWVQDRLPLLLRLAEQGEALHAGLKARSAAIEATGFEPQVTHLDQGVPLFLEVDGVRERLFLQAIGPEGPRFRTRDGAEGWTLDALAQQAAIDPSLLSPNVLSRPVVEAAILPTLAYVGGPGEIAYLAQTAPVFELLGVVPPVVHPRVSATVLERKVQKVLDRFGLPLEALSRPHDQLVAGLLREDLPEGVQQSIASLRTALDAPVKALRLAVEEIDPTLRGPVDGLLGQFQHAVGDVEKKIVQARRRQVDTALQQLQKAQTQLFPGGRPQERVFPALVYLARYGREALEGWRDAAAGAVLLD